jgi:isopentenyldiphosphate isomerase
MADELIDIYDENLKLLGTAMKSEAHRKGMWHKAIHCWIVRDQQPGYVLFQKRGRDKGVYPNALDISAAGHYQSGETPADGVREIMEELGLEVQFQRLIPLGIKIDVGLVGEHIVHEFCDVFLLREAREPREYQLNQDEVEGLVEIAIPDGVAMFADETKEVQAKGVEYDRVNRRWTDITVGVNARSVIPRVDPYYYKIFILADRLLRGEKHFAI